jgi:DNA uptake protein ComE-like DNA-binding protein
MFKLTQIKIRNKIANDPYYRFQSLTEIAIAVELGIKIDVNQAEIDDWLRLPCFSIHQARSLFELVKSGIQLLCLEDVAAAINVPLQRLQPYESLLTFAYYDRLSSLNVEKINLNTASVVEIAALPHLNPDLASQIHAEFQSNGRYRNLVDLQSRLNLAPELTSHLMYYLRF